MRPILKFRSRGKGTFKFRKCLKVVKNAVCDVERDAVNLEGESAIRVLVAAHLTLPTVNSAKFRMPLICLTYTMGLNLPLTFYYTLY